MSKFDSLSVALVGHIEKRFSLLPEQLRERVQRACFPELWDELTLRQRVHTLFNYDFERDPEFQDVRDQLSELLEDIFAIEDRVRREAALRWGLTLTPSPKYLRKYDKETEVRNFRVWFYEWWRSHNFTAPSRDEAYREFAAPRSLGRRWSNKVIQSMRSDLRQKVGQPGKPKLTTKSK